MKTDLKLTLIEKRYLLRWIIYNSPGQPYIAGMYCKDCYDKDLRLHSEEMYEMTSEDGDDCECDICGITNEKIADQTGK